MRRRAMLVLVFGGLCLLAASAHGQFYQWTDERGRVHMRLIMLDSGFLASVPEQMTPTVFREFAGGGAMEDLRIYERLSSEIDVSRHTIHAVVGSPPGSRILPEVFVVECRYK